MDERTRGEVPVKVLRISDAELLAVVHGRGGKEENAVDCSRRVRVPVKDNYVNLRNVFIRNNSWSRSTKTYQLVLSV